MTKSYKVYFDSTRKIFSCVDPKTGRVAIKSKKLILKNCKLLVSEKGNARVRKYKSKFPHAYIHGEIIKKAFDLSHAIKFSYNPYVNDKFTNSEGIPVEEFSLVSLNVDENGKTHCYGITCE